MKAYFALVLFFLITSCQTYNFETESEDTNQQLSEKEKMDFKDSLRVTDINLHNNTTVDQNNKDRDQVIQEQLALSKLIRQSNHNINKKLIEKYGFVACEGPKLIDIIQGNAPPKFKRNCIYNMNFSYGYKILQSLDDGYIMMLSDFNPYFPFPTIFLKTKALYADNQFVPRTPVKYIGLKKYLTVLGAIKTIHSFQDMD